jgi:alpha-galactosidase
MAEVWHDESAGVWLLEMSTTSYAFGLAGDGTALRHLHWGPLSQLAAIGSLAEQARSEPSSWERYRTWAAELPDEYVPWGGMRYDEPTLKAEYPDGTRGVELRFDGQRVIRDPGGATLEIDLADPAYNLRATLHYRSYHGFDVLDRWATLRNDGQGPVHVRQALSANWWLPTRRDWRLRYLHGGWGAETQLTHASLVPGKLVLESRRGTTSHEFNPWFTLDPDGAATEEAGEVWSGELAWSGSWKLVYELTAAGRVHVSGGWNDFDSAYRLAPGEELTTPPFAALYTTSGFGAASREWHRWQHAHVLGRGDRTAMLTRPAWAPQPASEPVTPASAAPPRPVLYNSWEATAFAVSHDGQERLAELAAGLGIECFVVDDGWFRGRVHDHAGLGDWSVDRSKFPAGLTPLIKAVNDLGMRFGLWVEPEMVNPDSDLYRAHPDWVYHFANRARTQHRNQHILNLARPDVAEWVFRTLDALLTEHDIRFVKWDMNRHFSEPGWPAAAERNPERIWIDHVRNLYAILDALREAHPGVDFESCSGGGGRVDLGILGRVEQVWTSDNTDAWDRILIQHGFSQAYTPQVMMAWVTDNANWLTKRRLPLRFQFHSAMAGSLGIGADLTAWSAAERAEAAELIAEYKVIRPVIQQGGLYRLESAGGAPFSANQYLADDGSELVVLGWWGPEQCGSGLHRLRLAGLEEAATYRDASTGEEHQGGVLMHEGLQLPTGIGNDYGSMLIRLARR